MMAWTGGAGLSLLLSPTATATGLSERGILSVAGGRAWLHAADNVGPFMFDTGAYASTVWRNQTKFISGTLGTVDVASIGEAASREKIRMAPLGLLPDREIPSHLGITAVIDDVSVSDVVLGTAAFSGHVVDLDFPGNSYSFSLEDVEPRNYANYFRAGIFRFGQVYIKFNDGRINDCRARGLLDTGSRITTIFPKAARRLKVMEAAQKIGPATYVVGTTGKITTAQYVKLASLEIADEVFSDLWCVVVTDENFNQHGSSEFLVGMDVASQFHIVLDLREARQVFMRRTGAASSPPLNLLDGYRFTSRDGKLWIHETEGASSGGIETLDDIFQKLSPKQVVEIDGVDFSRPDGAFKYAQFRDAPGDYLRLSVLDDNKRRSIQIPKLILN